MNWLFASGGQRIGASPSTSVLPMSFPGLISARTDWLELLVVQGTLKSLLQQHSLKASILQHSALFMAQLFTSIHDYWKNNSPEIDHHIIRSYFKTALKNDNNAYINA